MVFVPRLADLLAKLCQIGGSGYALKNWRLIVDVAGSTSGFASTQFTMVKGRHTRALGLLEIRHKTFHQPEVVLSKLGERQREDHKGT